MATQRTTASIVAAAQSYEHRWTYVFGGTPSPPGRLTGDCSSFITTVLGYNLHLALPGGKWGSPGLPPNGHGPVVTDYATWNGARTVTTAQPGDLCCFVGTGANGHIGIAVSVDRMVSALNPQDGCLETPIAGYGPPGAPLIYRRLLGIPEGMPELIPSGQRPSTSNPLVPLLIAGGVLAAGLAGLALAGTLVAMGITYLGSQVSR